MGVITSRFAGRGPRVLWEHTYPGSGGLVFVSPDRRSVLIVLGVPDFTRIDIETGEARTVSEPPPVGSLLATPPLPGLTEAPCGPPAFNEGDAFVWIDDSSAIVAGRVGGDESGGGRSFVRRVTGLARPPRPCQ